MTPLNLLLPHAVCLLAFAIAFAIMWISGTNRLTADLYAGVAGYIGLGLGVVATIAMLIVLPYSTATATQWLTFAGHFLLLAAGALAGFWWLAFHLA